MLVIECVGSIAKGQKEEVGLYIYISDNVPPEATLQVRAAGVVR